MQQQRFDNFKKFVESEVPNTMITYMLASMTLETFIGLITQMKGQFEGELDAHNASMTILHRLHLSPDQFSPTAMAKFQRYCQYFMSLI